MIIISGGASFVSYVRFCFGPGLKWQKKSCTLRCNCVLVFLLNDSARFVIVVCVDLTRHWTRNICAVDFSPYLYPKTN